MRETIPICERVRTDLLPRAGRIGVAVSGGADSVFLFHALRASGRELAVVHVNHCLRGAESDADQGFVAALAEAAGAPFLLRVAPVSGANIENAAREARRQFFHELIASGQVASIALGHTRSDQAETVLFRLIRGLHTPGLAAMAPVSADGLVRPLLDLSRGEIREWLTTRGIAWREDASNADPAFARNRMRNRWLPALQAENPRIEQALARTAALAREDEDYWAAEIEQCARELERDRNLSYGVEQLMRHPAALRRRLIRKLIRDTKGDLLEITSEHIAGVFDLLQKPSGRLRVPGVEVTVSCGRVRLAKSGQVETNSFNLPVAIPDAVKAPSGIIVAIAANGPHDTLRADLDWNRVQADKSSRDESQLVLRNWKPGDALRLAGRRRETKIKALFNALRIPIWERQGWPVLAGPGGVLWAYRFGPDAVRAANLRISVKEPENLHS